MDGTLEKMSDAKGLVEINPTTGSYRDINPLYSVGDTYDGYIQSLQFDENGQLIGATQENSGSDTLIYSVDTTTGQFDPRVRGDYGDSRGLAYAIPEPRTLSLFMIASAYIYYIKKRNRKRSGRKGQPVHCGILMKVANDIWILCIAL